MLAPALVAMVMAESNLATATASNCAVVIGAPYVKEPSALIVLAGTPEQ